MAAITPYDAIGGEKALWTLVERFYFYMDQLPDAKEVREMHQVDLASAKVKLFKFLSGWLGGPDLFVQEYGHPRLRARHIRFSIGQLERDQWMLCMNRALEEMLVDQRFKSDLQGVFHDLATHMINWVPT